MINKILLIYENFKELKDLYDVAIRCSKKITILSPSKLYDDKKSLEFLKELEKNKNVNILYLEYKNVTFLNMSKLKKIIISLKIKKKLINFDFSSFDLILSGVQTVFSRIVYKISRKYKVPFFVYHRHLIFPSPFNSKRRFIDNLLFKKLIHLLNVEELFVNIPNLGFADKYFVLGEVNKEYLIKNGVDKKNIVIIGSLEYDFLIDNYDNFNVYLDKKNKFSIVYITSAFEWVNQIEKERQQQMRIMNIISLVSKNKDKISFTIKIHPRENINKYKMLKKKFPFINLDLSSNNSIIEELYRYDLIIGWFSTAMFEISLLDKKVLFFIDLKDLDEYKEILNYIPSEAVITKISEDFRILGENIKVSKIIYFNKKEKALDRFIKNIKRELSVK